jgi:hypothetical protein
LRAPFFETTAGKNPLKFLSSWPTKFQVKVEAIQGQTGLSGSKNIKQNKALQSLKRRSVRAPTFAKINSCTYRMDNPKKNGAGWLMEVAPPGGAKERWIAQVGNWGSEPLPLKEAKRAAVAMLRERGKVEPRDWIAHLNKIAATEIDRVALATKRKQWPRDLVGSESRPGSMQMDAKLRDAILDAELLAATTHAEPLSEDGSRLEFYDDGYPKLPECLRRKQPS